MGQAKIKQKRNFNQKMRFSDGDLTILKYTFADNDELLYTLRKVFLQFELTADEQKLVKALTPELLAIIKKELIPELDPNVPLFQMQDLFNVVNFQEPDLFKLGMEIEARLIEKKYLQQQFEILAGGRGNGEIILANLLPKDTFVAGERDGITYLSARNLIVRHVETQLNVFKLLAGQSNETVDQTKERLQRDSAR